MSATDLTRGGDWLGEAWRSLSPFERAVAARACSGETTAELGFERQVPVSDVRRAYERALAVVRHAQRAHAPELPALVASILQEATAVTDAEVRRCVPPCGKDARAVLLTLLGAQHPTTWDGPLTSHWSFQPAGLDLQLRELASRAPFTVEQAEDVASELDLPDGVPWWDLLSAGTSPLLCRDQGWVPRAP